MPKVAKPLKDTEILNAKPKINDYTLFDGDGLLILIQPNNKKIWRFKYLHPVTRIPRLMTLGKYPEVTLKAARDLRATYRQMIAEGVDPKEAIAAEQEKQSKSLTFEAVAREWFKVYGKLAKCSEETLHRDLRKFENWLFPLIGNVKIDALKLSDIENALKTIQNKGGVSETARKIRGRIVKVLSYAVKNELIQFNPARELDGEVLQKRQSVPRPALPLEQIPDLLSRIVSYTGRPLTRLATTLSLHLFIRSSELRFARWDEIDFDNKMWTIPATRKAVEGVKFSDRGAKMKAAHFVPLSEQAIALLREIQQYSGLSDHIFPHESDPAKFMSEATINHALQRMGYDTKVDQCLHGFRTLACSSLNESGLFNADAIERQMSHAEKNKIRASYIHRAEFLAERKEIMEFWSSYLQHCKTGFISAREFGKQYRVDHLNANDHQKDINDLVKLLKAKYPHLEDDAA